MEALEATLGILVAIFTLCGGGWAAVRMIYRSRERFLFFSGCHLITLSLVEDLKKNNPRFRDEIKDHAFRPLVILPRKFSDYFKVKDGARVILRFKPPDEDELIVAARAFWFPESPGLWDLFDQPSISLVLRRYCGIERPILGNDHKPAPGWHLVEHGTTRNGTQELAMLHRTSKKERNLIWSASDKYCVRFWLPERNAKEARYAGKWEEGYFLEYSGISIKITKPSLFSLQS